jgi:ketosteroid isomerase-like protein
MTREWSNRITATAALVLAAAWFGASVTAQRAARRPAAASASAVRAAIEAGNKKFSDGAAKHDAALLVTAYTVDAEAFPPNSEMVKGRPALQKLWQSVLDSGVAAVDLKTTEVEAFGALAYEVGAYTMKTKDGAVADRGKYCVVWKRVNGEWLLHRDIWTTSLPEAKK